MAKQKIGSDKIDLDNELDMPDFDFDFGDAQKNRTPEEQIFAGVKEGAVSSFKNTDFIRRLIRQSMPPVYGDVEDVYNTVERNTSELYNKAVREIKPGISQVAQATQNLIPNKFKKSKDTLTKIKEWADSDKVKGFSREDAETIRNRNIAIEIGDVFSTMAKNQEEQHKEDSAKDAIKESIGLLKHKENKSIFSDIRNSLNVLTTYQDKITQAYQKKTLELQYRSYFTQLDILEENKRLYALSDTAFQKIAKNTALPEYVKIKDSERFKDLIKTKTMESLFGTTQSFINKTFKNAGVRLREHIDTFKSIAGEAAFASDMASSVGDMDDGPGWMQTLASGGTEFAVQEAAMRLGSKIRKAGEKAPKLQKAADNVRYGLTNLPEIVLDWVNKTDLDDNVATAGFKNVLKDLIGNQRPNMSISQMDINESQMPSFFSNRNSKSINEIIPGYLARILREIQIFRTGDESIGLTVYDPFKNKFDSSDVVKKSLTERLLPGGSIRAHEDNKENIFKLVDPENKLGTEQRDIVFDILTKNKFNKKLLTPERLSSKFLYSSDPRLTEDQIDSITGIFKSYFNFDKNDSELTKDKRNSLNEHISRIGSSLSNPAALIQQLVNLGYQDQLRETGLLSEDGASVDIAQVIEQYNSRAKEIKEQPDIKTVIQKATDNKPINDFKSTTDKTTVDFKIDDTISKIVDKLSENNQTLKDYLDLNKDNQKQFNGFIEQNVNALIKLDETLTGNSIKDEVTNTNVILERIEKFLAEKLPEIINTIPGNTQSGNTGNRFSFPDYDFREKFNETRDRADTWWNNAKGTFQKPIGAAWKYITKPSLKASWWGTKKAFQASKATFDISKRFLNRNLNKLRDKIDPIKDIFVPGEILPRLSAAKLKAGQYVDSVTDKVIETLEDLKDIKGNIIDKESGNIVLELKDLPEAFVKSSTGSAVISLGKYLGGKTWDLIRRGGNFTMGAATNNFQRLVRAATWTKNKVFDLLDKPIDIYVKGDKDPTLLATVMRNGGYISEKTGKPVYRPSEIDGPLFDHTGKNYALTLDQLKRGLVDVDGNTIKTPGMKLLGIGVGIATWGVRKALSATRFVTNAIKGGLDHTGNFFKGMLDSLNNGFGGKKSLEVLEQIRNILDERLPSNKTSFFDKDGDGDRDGSWQDQMENKEDSESEKKERTNTLVKPNRENSFDRMARLAKEAKNKALGWLGLGDDEDGPDIDIDIDGGDPKRKRRGRKPRGKLRRAADMFKKGGVLRGVGKAAGVLGRLGLGAAGLVGKAGLGLLAKGIPLLGSAIGATVSAVPAILGGIGAVISSPVFLTGAVAALAGYGAYKAYKYFTKKEYSFLVKMRMAQYGISIDQIEKVPQVMELERQVLQYTRVQDKNVNFNIDDVLVPKLMEIFDIDPGKNDNKTKKIVEQWLHWFAVRFKPTYSVHLTALHNLSPNTSLDKVDDLDGETKVKYINASRQTDANYEDTVTPFPDAPLQAGQALVDAYADKAIEEANKQIEKDKKDPSKKTGINVEGAAAVAASVGAANALTKDSGPSTNTQQLQQAGWFATQLQRTLSVLKSPLTLGIISPFAALGSVVFKSVGNKLLDVLGFSLTALEAVRFKSYGLTEMDRSKVSTIKKLEKELLDSITFDGNGNAYYSETADKILSKIGPEFGITDMNSPNASSWIIWFNQRFLPVYLNYVGLIRQGSGGGKASLDENKLSAQTKLDIANKLITTPGIWTVTSSPWSDLIIGTISSITKDNITYLEKQAKDKKVAEQKDSSAAKQNPTLANANNPLTTNQTPPTTQTQQVQDSSAEASDAWDRVNGQKPPDPKQTTDVRANVAVNTDKPKTIGTKNNFRSKGSFGGFGEDIDKYITEASKMYGMDEKVLRGFIKMEAGWGNQMSPTGAIGVGQFTQGTWDDLAKTKEGQELGMTKIGNRFRTPDDPRYDKRINTLATALLAKKNADMLKKAGLEATGENLYMMHNIGPGFIKAVTTGNASPATVKAMQLNGMKPGMTPTQFVDYQKGRFNQHYEVANQSSQVTIPEKTTNVQVASGAKEAINIYNESRKTTNTTNSGSYIGSVEKTKPTQSVVTPPKFAREDIPPNADEFASIMKKNKDLIYRSNKPDLNTQDILNTQLNNSVTSMHKTLESSLSVQRDMLDELKQISQGVAKISQVASTPIEQKETKPESTKTSPITSAAHTRKQDKFPKAPVSTS